MEYKFEQVDWVKRTAKVEDFATGETVFEQHDVEVPDFWSQNATNILAQKYFRGQPDSDERETSLKQVVDRIVRQITRWGCEGGYFKGVKEECDFATELNNLLVTQKAAFNSPVWFNIGSPGHKQQAAACFILSIDDSIEGILDWYQTEGKIFKYGSGAGVNLSPLRASDEPVCGGGVASGPVSFMRGADSIAGAIKSGGKTRRAAKMVILDDDHPDLLDFVWCKAREERKIRVLAEAGFDMGFDGEDANSVQYQNANNSVRLSDRFMHAVECDMPWRLNPRTHDITAKHVMARKLYREICEAAWECADPGVQFKDTINLWNTCSNDEPINASNPCSEYVHLDDTSCNLASINLLKFYKDGEFDVVGFRAAIDILITAQDILVGNADYPTERIGERTRSYRQLGLGYANLGALLMCMGLPYDSVQGRAVAAQITALLTGGAYAMSAVLAWRLGAYDAYERNMDPQLGVLKRHAEALKSDKLTPGFQYLQQAAEEVWDDAVRFAELYGVRNAQVTVLAPTGTIGLLMDCDTTGIEPDLALIKYKNLSGGGNMRIVNRMVPHALANLGYSNHDIEGITTYLDKHGSLDGAPHLRDKDRPVFQTALGENAITPEGHVDMMSAVQPFLSGAISKTVNMPSEATVEDVEALYWRAWKSGVKAVAIYRDNCKNSQPLNEAKPGVDAQRAGSCWLDPLTGETTGCS